jgi:hypothetical protein
MNSVPLPFPTWLELQQTAGWALRGVFKLCLECHSKITLALAPLLVTVNRGGMHPRESHFSCLHGPWEFESTGMDNTPVFCKYKNFVLDSLGFHF